MKKKYTRLPIDQPNPVTKGEQALWTPMLNIRVARDHKQTPRFPAIVDSGSPYCLFKSSVADYLGFDFTKGVEAPIYGVSGVGEPAFF